eukprot:365424-Chlamydomonas_euryale.AAC.9
MAVLSEPGKRCSQNWGRGHWRLLERAWFLSGGPRHSMTQFLMQRNNLHCARVGSCTPVALREALLYSSPCLWEAEYNHAFPLAVWQCGSVAVWQAHSGGEPPGALLLTSLTLG